MAKPSNRNKQRLSGGLLGPQAARYGSISAQKAAFTRAKKAVVVLAAKRNAGDPAKGRAKVRNALIAARSAQGDPAKTSRAYSRATGGGKLHPTLAGNDITNATESLKKKSHTGLKTGRPIVANSGPGGGVRNDHGSSNRKHYLPSAAEHTKGSLPGSNAAIHSRKGQSKGNVVPGTSLNGRAAIARHMEAQKGGGSNKKPSGAAQRMGGGHYRRDAIGRFAPK